jgi:streptogramin lyase
MPGRSELGGVSEKLQILLAERKAPAKIKNFDTLDLTFRNYKRHFSSLNWGSHQKGARPGNLWVTGPDSTRLLMQETIELAAGGIKRALLFL